MKVTIDIGNTNIVFAFFIDKRVIDFERLRTEKTSINEISKIMSKYFDIEVIIVSSVVPLIDKLLISYLNSKNLNFFF